MRWGRSAALVSAALACGCQSPLPEMNPEMGAGPDASPQPAEHDAGSDPEGPIGGGLPIRDNPSVQAEEYSTAFGLENKYWVIVDDADASAGRYLRGDADANCRTQDACDPLTETPRATFELKAAGAGLHYLWVRGRADNVNEDSLHLGVDGELIQSDWDFDEIPEQWVWRRSTGFNIDEPGVHSIDIYLRESGFKMDQLLMTADESLVPDDGHRAPPLIWEAEDGRNSSGSDSEWRVVADAGASDGMAMRLEPGEFTCECSWSDGNSNGLRDYGECLACGVEDASARLTFNKAFENSTYSGADRVWVRARFSGTARVHLGFTGSQYGENLHGDKILQGGDDGYSWHAIDLPGEAEGQRVHTSEVHLYGGTADLVVDQMIMTSDLTFVPADPG